MFNRKEYVNAVQQFTEQIKALKAEADKLSQQISVSSQTLAGWGNAFEIVAAMEQLRTDMFTFHHDMAGRVGRLESQQCEIRGTLHRHEQTFRALGADMMLRAAGDGSVAPVIPTKKKARR